jgi:hypothetical protein
MTRALLFCCIVTGSALSAQQQLVGKWQLSFPAGMRIENGVATPLMATGVLTIEAKGDSLLGELITNPSADVPSRPPTHLAAPATTAGQAVFVSHSEATVNRNGEQQKATVVSTWRLGVGSDSLVGTVERQVEGVDMGTQEPRPVTGVRAKG